MAPSPGAVYNDYFNNKTLSDLTIRIGDRQVHVHRIVLSSHSAYFNKLLTSGFKVRGALALSCRALTDSPNRKPTRKRSSCMKTIPQH